jgi:TRAP-type mannitol/chloroaromatic compound transport system substrate-binding protein
MKTDFSSNKQPGPPRRRFFKALALTTAAICGASFMTSAVAAKTQTWKVQSTWDAGTIGYTLFEEWSNNMEEKTNGALRIKPFPAKSVIADNSGLFDAVRNGVLQGMNPWTLYWSGKIPATVFLSSYPAGPDQPAQWDLMFYKLGLLEKAREIYAKQGLFYVGPIHHDANIIHSKKPVKQLADMKGMKVRLPGGMVAEVFQKFGIATVSLPGSDIFPALEKGTIDAADFVGPAVNWELGFAQVTDNILFGPPGMMSLYQPVDVMDLTINMKAWNKLSDETKAIVESEVRLYSQHHYLEIQAANIVALEKFKKAGSKVNRLSQQDVEDFRKAAIPVWFDWANKDKDAQDVFKIQLDFMKSELMGYVTDEDIKGLELEAL